MRRIFTPLVAVTAGLALLVLSAAPGAAGTVGISTGGTATVNLTPVLNVPLAGSTTSFCPKPGLGVSMATGSGTTTGTGTVTVSLGVEFTYNSVQYLLFATGSTTITLTTGSVSVAGFTITGVTLRPVTGSTTCSLAASRCATISITFASALAGTLTSGTISGTGFSASSVIHLAGTGAIAATTCTPPFSTLNGKTITIASWTNHFA